MEDANKNTSGDFAKGEIEVLISKLELYKKRYWECKIGGALFLAVGAGCLVASFSWQSLVEPSTILGLRKEVFLGSIGTTLFILGIISLSTSYFFQREYLIITDDIRTLKYHAEWQKYNPTDNERRAEKLLEINNYQLKRYYQLNLSQATWIFAIGITCLATGLTLIVLTFYFIDKKENIHDSTKQIIIGVVGSAGSILVNYVAAIYLKMYASINQELKGFQSKLILTQELYLSNLISSHIKDDTLRYNTFSSLSLAIAQKAVADDPKK